MKFDYNEAMKKVDSDFSQLVEEMYPKCLEGGYHKPPSQEKDKRSFVGVAYPDRNGLVMQKYYMLEFLLREKYWTAGQNWKESFRGIPKEDAIVYKKSMVHQAVQHAKSKENSELAYAWLVENYDNGLLKDVVTKNQLKIFVNHGFVDLAKYIYNNSSYYSSSNTHGRLEMENRCNALMNHAELLEPELLDFGGSLSFFWMNKNYENFFENNVRNRMPHKKTAKMAFPLISKIIEENYDRDNMIEVDVVKKKLEKYKEFFTSDINHDFLISRFASFIDFNMVDPDYANWCYSEFFDFVSDYIEIDKKDMLRILNTVGNDGTLLLARSDFPERVVDSEVRAQFNQKFVSAVENAHKYTPRADIPYLGIIKDASEKDLLSSYGKKRLEEIITKDVKQMASRKKTKKLKSLAKVLEPWMVEPSLYKQLVNGSISKPVATA